MSQPEGTGTHPAKLKSDVIGLLGAATLGVVCLSPAMTLYGLFGPIFIAAGSASAMSFVFALLATLPTACSYALLSRDFPTTGSAADWSALATNKRVGVWTGWLVFLYYFTNFVIQPAALGLFFTEFLAAFGFDSAAARSGGAIFGILFCCAWPAWMVYRGISISAKGALGFLLVEITVVVALCASIIVMAPHRGMHLSLEGFAWHSIVEHKAGLFQAMVFAMLGFCGFDVISTVAEETKMARKLIPQATILALLFYAVLIIVGMWALTMGGDPAELKKLADEGRMPINEVARSFWGRGSILVTLTGISATLGLAIVTPVGASRILFSMGRAGLAPAACARLHPKYCVPWTSLNFIFAGGLIGSSAAFFTMGSYKAYTWWATTTTFFGMMTYLFVNLSVILLNRSKVFSGVGAFLLFGLIPALGIAADGYILIQSFFIDLWNQGWETGKSVLLFDVGCAGVALVLAFRSPKQTASVRSGV